MTRPTISISDRETFVEAAKHRGSSLVRVIRTWTTIVVEQDGKWREQPAVRFYYEVDVETDDGPMTWYLAEVLPLDDEGRVQGEPLQARLERESLKNKVQVVTSQSGSF
jgi:hypothetical protein